MEPLPFIDQGKGHVVVFLHAFPFDARMWTPQVKAVSSVARFVAPYLRGFGRARDLEPRTSIEENADDVAALLDHLGAQRATLVGCSMGGYVALAFAKKYAARLSSLVLVSTRAAADSDDAKANRAKNIELLERQGVKALVDAAMPSMLADRTSDVARAKIREIGEDQPVKTLIAAQAAMRDRPDRTEELASIAVPVVLVSGDQDPIVSEAEMTAMGKRIQNARLISIQGARHLPNVDASGPFSFALSLVGAAKADGEAAPPRI